MSRLRPFALAALILVIPASSAWADVIINSFSNTISACVWWNTDPKASANSTCNSSGTTSSNVWTGTDAVTDSNPVGAGDATVAQSSYVATTQGDVTSFGGTLEGSATVTNAVGDASLLLANGEGAYTVRFTLTEAYSYVLTGAFSAVSTDLSFQNRYSIGLYDPNFVPIAYLYGDGNDAASVAQDGILAPGDYYFAMVIQGIAISGANWGGGGTVNVTSAFDLSLTQVASVTAPEPASMLLLGTGLLGTGARRWRQRRT